MGDSLSIIFATIVSAIIMFLFPMLDTWERQDDLSYMAAYTAVVDTVDAVRNTGRLTEDMYEDLITKIDSTGNRFDIQMEHRANVVGTKKIGTDPSTGDDIFEQELLYLYHYTSEIEDILKTSGEYTNFEKGDYFYISVKNSNYTQSTVLKQRLYGVNMELFKIGVPYGGQVKSSFK